MPVAYNPSSIYQNDFNGFNPAGAGAYSSGPSGYGGSSGGDYGTSQSNYQNWLRYQQGLGINSAMQQNATKYGQTALQNIGNWQQQAQAGGQQGLISRGLGNTTILNAMNQGIGAQATQQRNAVGESQAMMQNSILGNRQQWIGGRTDQPAMSPFQGGYAQGQAGMGGIYGAMNQQMMGQGYLPTSQMMGPLSNAQPQGVPGMTMPQQPNQQALAGASTGSNLYNRPGAGVQTDPAYWNALNAAWREAGGTGPIPDGWQPGQPVVPYN